MSKVSQQSNSESFLNLYDIPGYGEGEGSSPLTQRSENAALRLVQGLPMSYDDWDALNQRSANEILDMRDEIR
jgi:hypothetical protein